MRIDANRIETDIADVCWELNNRYGANVVEVNPVDWYVLPPERMVLIHKKLVAQLTPYTDNAYELIVEQVMQELQQRQLDTGRFEMLLEVQHGERTIRLPYHVDIATKWLLAYQGDIREIAPAGNYDSYSPTYLYEIDNETA